MNRKGCIITGAVVLLLLAVGIAFVVRKCSTFGDERYGAVINRYNALTNSGDYERAYAETASEWKQVQRTDQFSTYESLVHSRLGQLKSYEIETVHFKDGIYAIVETNAVFDLGKAQVQYVITKEKGTDRLARVHYNSPLLADLLVCPHCRQTNKTIRRLCEHCSKSILAR